MTKRMQGYLFLSLAMILVGSTVIVSKIIGAVLLPFAATWLRLAIALPVFVLLMRSTRTAWPELRKSEWLILTLQASAGTVAYTALLILGLRLTSGTDAGIVIGTLPVVSAGISMLVLREKPERWLIAAVMLATAGVCTIAFQQDDTGVSSLAGNALVFAAIICESLFILLNKRLRTPIEPLALSTLVTGIGFAVSLIPALVETAWLYPSFEPSRSLPVAATAILYYALIPTVGGFILWYAGAARVSGTEASLFTALAPVSTMILAVGLLGESVHVGQIAGIGCVLTAVISLALRNGTRGT